MYFVCVLNSGPVRPVRRQVFPADGPAGQGIVWQWSGDRQSEWHSYDYEVAHILESALRMHQPMVDLSQQSCALPYKIDLMTMSQIRVETGYARRVQRVASKFRYTRTAPITSTLPASSHPPVNVNAPAAHSFKLPSSSSSSSTSRQFSANNPFINGYYHGLPPGVNFGMMSAMNAVAMQLPPYAGLPFTGALPNGSQFPPTSLSMSVPAPGYVYVCV